MEEQGDFMVGGCYAMPPVAMGLKLPLSTRDGEREARKGTSSLGPSFIDFPLTEDSMLDEPESS